MKKATLLIIAVVLAAIMAQAQNNTLEILGHTFSMVFNYDGNTYNAPIFKTCKMVEKPNGDLLLDNYFRRRVSPNASTMVSIGDGFYTVSRQGLVVTDSTFLEPIYGFEEDHSAVFLAHDPVGEGYVYVKILNNSVSSPGWDGFTWLAIYHADENLNFETEPTMVPLEDTHIETSKGIILENDENLVVRYVLNRIPVLARIGLDGTVKDKQPLPDLFHGEEWRINGIVAYTDSPREYAIYGWDTTPEGDTTFLFHVVDSLFNLKETVAIENNQTWPYRYFNNIISMLPYDDETYYAVSQFAKETPDQYRNGLRIVKYDKASHEELGEALLLSQPIYTNLDYCAFLLGLEKADDGNLYLGYRSCNYPKRGYIVVTKLDTDLNVLWERRCHAINTYEDFNYYRMKSIEQGVALCMQHTMTQFYQGEYHFNTLLFLIHDDGTTSIPEMDEFIRPYAFYPNPVQDWLHLQYSPDVQPACIELYDLQGRLVSKQSQGLDNIELQGLAPGQYVMKVTMEDGKTYTDKVLKE
ncbi:MAG: T9SS type A sorting domain-containing protein [bacterium]|nr:T9SS type A sorting domain-containing protein [bacterium]